MENYQEEVLTRDTDVPVGEWPRLATTMVRTASLGTGRSQNPEAECVALQEQKLET